MSTISNEQRKQLRIGMSAEELHAMLGPPTEILDPSNAVTPSRAFAELGSQFRFGEESIDAIWTYSDDKRPRAVHCLGIQKQRLVAVWRVITKDV